MNGQLNYHSICNWRKLSDMHKRQREEDAESRRPKKKVQRSDAVPLKAFVPKPAAPAPAAEIDFPRGGGSSFTPLETKAIRSEALQELQDEQIFKVRRLDKWRLWN